MKVKTAMILAVASFLILLTSLVITGLGLLMPVVLGLVISSAALTLYFTIYTQFYWKSQKRKWR